MQAAASPAASPMPVPRAARQGCTRIPNGIKGLLAWSSHPNPAGRPKVSLGQKALAVRAWPWPLTSVQLLGPGQQPQSPHCWVVTATGQPLDTAGDTAATWGPQPCWHWMWECGAGTAPLGVSGTSSESSCCPAKFLFFTEIPNSMPGKKQMRAEQVPGPVQGKLQGHSLGSLLKTQNSRAGLVRSQKLRKQLKKNPLFKETPDSGVWKGIKPSCFGA